MYLVIPKTILSDRSLRFMSQLINDLTNIFKTKYISISSSISSTIKWRIERNHLTLKEYLKHYIKSNLVDWTNKYNFQRLVIILQYTSSTKYIPYEIFGRPTYLPTSITQELKFNTLTMTTSVHYKISRILLLNLLDRISLIKTKK